MALQPKLYKKFCPGLDSGSEKGEKKNNEKVSPKNQKKLNQQKRASALLASIFLLNKTDALFVIWYDRRNDAHRNYSLKESFYG